MITKKKFVISDNEFIDMEKSEKNINPIKNLKKRLNVNSYYRELAEMDLLLDYVKTYMPEKFANDDNFRQEIFEIIYDNATKITPELEVFLLEKLIHSLSYFNELISEWNLQSR